MEEVSGDVATQIEQSIPRRVTSVNKVVYRPDGSILTDIDIELDNIVIQVKTGGDKYEVCYFDFDKW